MTKYMDSKDTVMVFSKDKNNYHNSLYIRHYKQGNVAVVLHTRVSGNSCYGKTFEECGNRSEMANYIRGIRSHLND